MDTKVIAIIQARMGSSRLPRKVLMEVNGKPLLWYLIERLKKCNKISEIILATSKSPTDDAIEDFCRKNSFDFFRGSENDVLDRYYQCALAHKAEAVVRITGDCPLLDPELTSEVIDFYLNNPGFDLVRTGPSYPEGFDAEIFPFASLETTWKEARLESEREHVSCFLWKNDKRFKIKTLSLDKDYSFLRLTVDEPLDFEVVSAVIKELYGKKGIGFSFQDILCLYKEKPHIFEKNKNIIRNEGYIKSLKKDRIVK